MPSSKGWKTRADERTMHDTPIGSIVDELLVRERAFARGLPIGRLAAEWAQVVGARLGSESAPLSLDGGVLVVAASSGPWGAQVRFMTDEIRRRANQRLGSDIVSKVQVVVRSDPQKGL
jgi:predicted nucleic acid-binding Zn ribbon protein